MPHSIVSKVLEVLVPTEAPLRALLPTSSAAGRDGACQICPAVGQIQPWGCPAWAEHGARLLTVVTATAGLVTGDVIWHRHSDRRAPGERGMEIRSSELPFPACEVQPFIPAAGGAARSEHRKAFPSPQLPLGSCSPPAPQPSAEEGFDLEAVLSWFHLLLLFYLYIELFVFTSKAVTSLSPASSVSALVGDA